jgi:hypothetical protein
MGSSYICRMLPALLVVMLLFMQAHGQSPPAGLTCGVRDAQTAALHSSAGFTAVLKMHSEDDHGKNTHLCETDYSLQITRPDGSADPEFDLQSSDDDWNRPIVFRVEGFSRDGRHVFVFISEGEYPGWVQAMDYDMSSGARSKDVFLDRHFTRNLGSACVGTLYIVGISPEDLMVLGSRAKDGCARAELWQLKPNGRARPESGGATLPEYPKRISATAHIATLDPGILMRP